MKFRSRPLDDEFLRIRLLLAAIWLSFAVLGARLWMIQVARGQQFAQRQEQQSIRRVRLPGARGEWCAISRRRPTPARETRGWRALVSTR